MGAGGPVVTAAIRALRAAAVTAPPETRALLLRLAERYEREGR